jgi:hypothetical protein
MLIIEKLLAMKQVIGYITIINNDRNASPPFSTHYRPDFFAYKEHSEIFKNRYELI